MRTEYVITGMYNQPGKPIGSSFVDGITKFLYRAANETYGLDLPATTLQRGREHGIDFYLAYRTNLVGDTFSSYADARKKGIFKDECYEKLELYYPNVKDIELYIGGLCEVPTVDGIVGPTFGNIIAQQFNAAKFGDRFYYTHDKTTVRFFDDELDEINKMMLKDVVCTASIPDAVDRYGNIVYFDFSRRAFENAQTRESCYKTNFIDVSTFDYFK